ncbi:hypothetical protein BSKO_05917 [Bryopsis sp. KO-2023]|nr:hypothetical protein BSKO_05917 [Bryopsis sp. KO-2023]
MNKKKRRSKSVQGAKAEHRLLLRTMRRTLARESILQLKGATASVRVCSEPPMAVLPSGGMEPWWWIDGSRFPMA